MNRFLLLVCLFAQSNLSAQLMWITECSDKNFCVDMGGCTEGYVFLVEKAVTNCFSSPIINYSHKIDLNNDGSTEVNSNQDTVSGQFPKGTHKITWRATDNCGSLIQCTYLFTLKDCQPPHLVCINGLTQVLDEPFCVKTFTAAQFILSMGDNCTPTPQIQIGIRETGTGTGFPDSTSITFDKCDAGLHFFEVWVKDGSNLVNQCNTYIILQTIPGMCVCNLDADLHFEGCARSADSLKLSNFRIEATVESISGLPNPLSKTVLHNSTDSCYSALVDELPFGGTYRAVVRASRSDNYVNGVSTFDLLQVSKHILNIQPFQNLYQRLAADVNASNTVTTFDIVETRKLILGIYDTFPAVKSWRFIRPLADPTNIMSAVRDTYQITLPNLTNDLTLTGLDFVGIKMGDANLSASFTNDDVDDREPLLLSAEDRFLNAGETVAVPVRMTAPAVLSGWQTVFAMDPAFAKIEGVEGLPEENFSLSGNAVRALWFDAERKQFSKGETIFVLKIKASQPVLLSQILNLAAQNSFSEAYAPAEGGLDQRRPLLFKFDAQSEQGATFFPPRPNPFGEETMFGLLLRQPGEASLEVFDVSGKKVLENNFEMGAGFQSLSISAAQLPGSGVFFYRVRANGEVFSGRMVRN